MTARDVFLRVTLGVFFLHATSCQAENRIWLQASINGKKVKLIFDSGSSASVLATEAAKRLGVRFNQATTKDPETTFLTRSTEDLGLNLEGTDVRTSFLLLDWPQYETADFDGLIGWPMFSGNVFRINAMEHEIEFMSNPAKRVAQWIQFSILTNSDVLDLELPHRGASNGVLYVDTGSSIGLELPPRKWAQWKEAHPNAPLTIDTSYSPMEGFHTYEEAWADEISVGPLVLTGVPIDSCGDGNIKRLGDSYEGTLGMAALTRLDMIVDGPSTRVYVRTKKTTPPQYTHNRLAAVFVPSLEYTNSGIARVVKGGPAYESGVRDGDILVAVDDVPVKGWDWSWRHHFYLRAGTKLKLTLKRQDKEFHTTATLREILKPNPRTVK